MRTLEIQSSLIQFLLCNSLGVPSWDLSCQMVEQTRGTTEPRRPAGPQAHSPRPSAHARQRDTSSRPDPGQRQGRPGRPSWEGGLCCHGHCSAKVEKESAPPTYTPTFPVQGKAGRDTPASCRPREAGQAGGLRGPEPLTTSQSHTDRAPTAAQEPSLRGVAARPADACAPCKARLAHAASLPVPGCCPPCLARGPSGSHALVAFSSSLHFCRLPGMVSSLHPVAPIPAQRPQTGPAHHGRSGGNLWAGWLSHEKNQGPLRAGQDTVSAARPGTLPPGRPLPGSAPQLLPDNNKPQPLALKQSPFIRGRKATTLKANFFHVPYKPTLASRH